MKKWSEFKPLLFNKDIDKKMLFEVLKSDFSIDQQRKIVKNIPKAFHSLLHGQILPKDYKSIGSDERGVKNDIEAELNWLVNQISIFKDKLNLFLDKRTQFEKAILIGDYETSQSVLNDIQSQISYSYWGMECQFIQTQFEKGYEENANLYSKIQEFESNDPAYYFLSCFFHFKVEDDITIQGYEKELNYVRNKLKSKNEFREYFEYRLNYFAYSFESYDRVLWVARNQPIIDKYLVVRDYLAHYYSDKDRIKEDKYREHLDVLLKSIEDPLYSKINLLRSGAIILDNETNNLVEVFDLYTVGDYSSVVKKLNTDLISNPNNSSLLVIYTKSLLQLGEKFSVPEKLKGTILEYLMEQLYLFLQRGVKTNSAIYEILKVTNGLQNLDISKQTMSFIENFLRDDLDDAATNHTFMYSRELNVIDYQHQPDIKSKVIFLESFKNSLTANFFLSLIDEGKGSIKELDRVPNDRRSHYQALRFLKDGVLDKAEVLLQESLVLSEHVHFIYEHVLRKLFTCLVQLGKFDAAVRLYVKSFLKNSFLVQEIQIEEVAHKIAKLDRFKKVDTSNLDIAIFMSLSDTKTSNIYVAYNLFLKSIEVRKPSEINIQSSELEKERLIFFLRAVCTTKIMSRAVLVFKTSLQVLEERLLINQLLIRLDDGNQEAYSKEITQITRDLNVQKRKKEIDQSKIYVDEYGLINTELEQTRKGFDRYRNITELLKDSTIEGIGLGTTSLLQLILGEIDSQTYQESLKKSDYQYIIFRQLYFEIRDKFLFSDKFGLDYYLSTRIRHGTIEGQLRRSFNNSRLATNRDKKTDEYNDDTFWVNKYDLNNDQKSLFHKRIKLFSRNIDAIITNLKNDLIQIKTEDPATSQNGLFDFGYYVSATLKRHLYSGKCQYISDFDDLVNEILDYLWDVTEYNLKLIRRTINIELKSKIMGEIESFEHDVSSIFEGVQCVELYTQITNCKTAIQKDIDTVEIWFNRSKSFEVDFKIEDVIASSIDTVNNIDPDLNVRLQENIEFDYMIKGMYFIHFDDLLKIFFNNAANYIKTCKGENIPCEINVKEQDDAIIIEVVNGLKKSEDIEAFNRLIHEKFDSIKSSVGLRSDKDSGLKKAANILGSVFRNDKNKLSVKVENHQVKFTCEIVKDNLIVR